MPAATTVSMTSDARPVSGWSSIRQSRGPLLAAAVLLICLLLALHRGATESAGGQAADECGNAEDELRGLSRHGRRRRRREVLTQVKVHPKYYTLYRAVQGYSIALHRIPHEHTHT